MEEKQKKHPFIAGRDIIPLGHKRIFMWDYVPSSSEGHPQGIRANEADLMVTLPSAHSLHLQLGYWALNPEKLNTSIKGAIELLPQV